MSEDYKNLFDIAKRLYEVQKAVDIVNSGVPFVIIIEGDFKAEIAIQPKTGNYDEEIANFMVESLQKHGLRLLRRMQQEFEKSYKV